VHESATETFEMHFLKKRLYLEQVSFLEKIMHLENNPAFRSELCTVPL
jgi:ribosomal protein S10